MSKEKTYNLPGGGIAISDNPALVKKMFYDKPEVAAFITDKKGKVVGYYECVIEKSLPEKSDEMD